MVVFNLIKYKQVADKRKKYMKATVTQPMWTYYPHVVSSGVVEVEIAIQRRHLLVKPPKCHKHSITVVRCFLRIFCHLVEHHRITVFSLFRSEAFKVDCAIFPQNGYFWLRIKVGKF